MSSPISTKVAVEGEGKFRSALNDMNAGLKALSSEMKAVTAAFDTNESSMESLAKQNEVLGRKSEALANKLDLIKSRLQAFDNANVDKTSKDYQNLVRQLYDTEAEFKKTKAQIKSNTEAMEQLGEEVEDAGEAMEDAGDSALSFGDILKANLTSEAIISGAKAIGSALLDLGKDAIQGYADLEQLTGGVETLFKSSASQVQAYAQDAYKTAGLSANEYMETVTGFSASLIKSLGGDTKAAAKLADQAITDMADNANKFGSTIDSIQIAYQGFAKQNYTMLDNLKLGYGGTKTEMERLLADAEKLSGIHYDISSYADIVEAIHVVQTEMGITGTTALEASETISGSVSSVESAWNNLVSGMADENADVGKLVADWMDSVQTAASNIGTAVFTILGNLELFSQGVSFDHTIDNMESASEKLRAAADNTEYWNEQMASSIDASMIMSGGMEHLTLSVIAADEQLRALQNDEAIQIGIYEELTAGTLTTAEAAKLLSVSEEELAPLMEQAAAAAEANAQGFASATEAEEALAAMTHELSSSYPGFVEAANEAGVSVDQLSQYLIDNELTAEEWASKVSGAVDGIVNGFKKTETSLDMSLEEMQSSLRENITAYNEWNVNIATLMDAAAQSQNKSAVEFVSYMQDLGVGAAAQVAEMVRDVDGTLADFAPLFAEAAQAGMMEVENSIGGETGPISDAVTAMMDSAKDAADTKAEEFTQAGEAITEQTASGIDSGAGTVSDSTESAISSALREAQGKLDEFRTVGYQISAGIAAGIQSGSGAVAAAARSIVQIALSTVKAESKVASPSKLFRDEVGYFIGLGVAKGIEDAEDEAAKAADQLAQKVYSASQKWVSRAVKYQRLSTAEELELWKTVQKQFVKGSEQYEDAYERIFDLKEKLQKEDFENSKNWITEQIKYYDLSVEEQIAAWERVKARFAEGTEQYAEATANIFDLTWQREKDAADALQSRVEEIYSIYGLFDEIPERERKSAQELAKNLQDQINNLQGFFNGLEDLSARGMSDALVDEIRAMGPAALDELNALLSMSDEELDEYAELYGEKQRLANEIALRELQTLGDDTIIQIADNLAQMEALYDMEAPDVGLAFSDGLANGILSGESTVISAAVSVAQAALAATKDTLGIHSPSTAYEDVGINSAEGYAIGFIEHMRQIQSRMTAAIPVQDISLADAASGIVNGLSGQYGGYNGAIPVVIPISINGRVVAEATIDDFFAVASANGTPLTADAYE